MQTQYRTLYSATIAARDKAHRNGLACYIYSLSDSAEVGPFVIACDGGASEQPGLYLVMSIPRPHHAKPDLDADFCSDCASLR